MLSDLFVYWGHRLQHRVSFLWRFHSIHHSAEHLDWLAAHREHPVDTIYTMGVINLPPFLLGFPLETLAGVIAEHAEDDVAAEPSEEPRSPNPRRMGRLIHTAAETPVGAN